MDDPSVAETARELADTVLAEPVGTVRPFYDMGTTARQCAAFLIACDDQSTVGTGEPTRLLHERVAAHLLLWAEDRNDTADRRSEAVHALSILAETLPTPVRDDMFERLMGLYSNPGEHPADAFDRRTQHPLSRFKINTGGDWRLPAEILHATAVFATTAEQAIRVEQRLLPLLTHPEQKRGHGWLQARTVLALDRLAPAPTSLTATHPTQFVRQTAVICWGRADHRDPSLARVFAKDSDTSVRHNLARILAELPQANASSTKPSPNDSAPTTAHASAKPPRVSHEHDTGRHRVGHAKTHLSSHTVPIALAGLCPALKAEGNDGRGRVVGTCQSHLNLCVANMSATHRSSSGTSRSLLESVKRTKPTEPQVILAGRGPRSTTTPASLPSSGCT